jgi:cobyrinic acid a,c-diamide synthase
MKGLIVAGTKSGCGKTTISLGLMAALTRRGLKVAPFKIGPDFIDPGHHTRVTGSVSRNLDGWMLSKDYNLELFRRYGAYADIAIVEGVMGLFDGYDGKSEAGSSAQMAKWLHLPVVLMVDAGSMARSAAAIVSGFERFDEDLTFAGVIFNNLGSDRHLRYLTDALVDNVQMTCLGGIQRSEAIAIPERHLGLVTQQDHVLTPDNLNTLANLIEETIDLDNLLTNLPDISLPDGPARKPESNGTPCVRIGIAWDNAFCFYYRDNFDLLEENGAELIFFSPMSDPQLPPNIDGLYFGGGYPELNAAQLEANASLKAEIKRSCMSGMPIYGECGGFMYLCNQIEDQEGNRYAMTDCFPFSTKMFPRLKALGYREVVLTADTIIGKTGQRIRGHEFHYSELENQIPEMNTVYRISDRTGLNKPPDGYLVQRTLGSYNHLHFGSQPQTARNMVETCYTYHCEKEKQP